MNLKKIEKGTISVAFVHEAIQCLRDRGLDEWPLLAKAGISPELLASPQARVSSTHYGVLWHGIAQTLDDEFFGLDSHRMKAGSFTLLCHSVIHSDTLDKALRRAIRFLGLVLDDLQGSLQIEEPEEGRVKAEVAFIQVKDGGPDLPMRSSLTHSAPPKPAFAYGTYLLILHGLACWLIGRRIPILSADFRCTEPPFSGEWSVLFSQDLHFSKPCSGIRFSASYLSMKVVQNEKTMKEFLRSAPANFLVKYNNSSNLSAQIRRKLRNTAPAEWPNFSELVQQFHVSEATLRRRLDDEGESYQGIRDGLRRDLAIGLLSNSQKSLADIAQALGFSETSAFHRAFKKWTGIRAGEYRVIGKAEGI
ncbi:MAG: AraC family transcriptional regulator [Limnobacter sp.]|nr:AraC family transcriptional regulator [Limnobacter sp.]